MAPKRPRASTAGSGRRGAGKRSKQAGKGPESPEVNPWSEPPPPGQQRMETFWPRPGDRLAPAFAASASTPSVSTRSVEVPVPEAPEPGQQPGAGAPEESGDVAQRSGRGRKRSRQSPDVSGKVKAKPKRSAAKSRAAAKAKQLPGRPLGKAKAKAKACLRRPAAAAPAAPPSDSPSSSSSSTSSSSASAQKDEQQEAEEGLEKNVSLRYESLDDGFGNGGALDTLGSAAECVGQPGYEAQSDGIRGGESSPLRTSLHSSQLDDDGNVRCAAAMFRYPYRHAKRVLDHFGPDAFRRLGKNLDGCVLLSLYSGLGGAELSLQLGFIHVADFGPPKP